jgi:hypothetical protein
MVPVIAYIRREHAFLPRWAAFAVCAGKSASISKPLRPNAMAKV